MRIETDARSDVLIVISTLNPNGLESSDGRAGAGVMIAGSALALAVLANTSDPQRGEAAMSIGLVIVAPGAVIGFGGLLGMGFHEPPPPAELERDVDPECLRQRGLRLKRAEVITNRDQRTKALLAIPVSEPVFLQRATPPEHRDEREQAFTWTKTAAQAARLGDCATTIEIEHRVRDLDANVHATVFLRDVAIKICLDAAREPPSGFVDPFAAPAGQIEPRATLPPTTQPAPTVTPPGATP